MFSKIEKLVSPGMLVKTTDLWCPVRISEESKNLFLTGSSDRFHMCLCKKNLPLRGISWQKCCQLYVAFAVSKLKQNLQKIKIKGMPRWLSGWASAFGPGRDPGVPELSPTSGSLHGACFSLCLCLCLSLRVSHEYIKSFKKNREVQKITELWREKRRCEVVIEENGKMNELRKNSECHKGPTWVQDHEGKWDKSVWLCFFFGPIIISYQDAGSE